MAWMLLWPVPWNSIRSSISRLRFTFRSCIFFLQKNSQRSKFCTLWMDLIGSFMVRSYSLATSLNS